MLIAHGTFTSLDQF